MPPEKFNRNDSLRLAPVLPGAWIEVRTQGEVLFLGSYWMYLKEARALRDWLNQVIP